MPLRRRTVISLLVAATVAIVAGGALATAAGNSSSPSGFVQSLAKHLGISTEKLQDAAKAAAIDQVDAALAAGEITKEQADALKERIKSGETPLFFGPGFRHGGPGAFGFGFGFRGPDRFGPLGPGGFGFHFHHFGSLLSAAAEYLGISEAELRTELRSGSSLADVAKAKGKSTDGLTKALHDAVKKDLDAAVKAGRITQAQADEALARFDEHADELIAKAPGSGRPMGRIHARVVIF
jgi:hypothetical protein